MSKYRLAFVMTHDTGLVHFCFEYFAYSFCQLHFALLTKFYACEDHGDMFVTCLACVVNEAQRDRKYEFDEP